MLHMTYDIHIHVNVSLLCMLHVMCLVWFIRWYLSAGSMSIHIILLLVISHCTVTSYKQFVTIIRSLVSSNEATRQIIINAMNVM